MKTAQLLNRLGYRAAVLPLVVALEICLATTAAPLSAKISGGFGGVLLAAVGTREICQARRSKKASSPAP
jgi:hypothetical protein